MGKTFWKKFSPNPFQKLLYNGIIGFGALFVGTKNQLSSPWGPAHCVRRGLAASVSPLSLGTDEILNFVGARIACSFERITNFEPPNGAGAPWGRCNPCGTAAEVKALAINFPKVFGGPGTFFPKRFLVGSRGKAPCTSLHHVATPANWLW
jgi:hypothetical protein